MNHTSNSVRSASSSDQLTRRSFRVIVKNRITHQNVEPNQEKSKSQIINVRNSIENFDQAKQNLKKYIRHMKASSKVGNYESKQHTNRSSHSQMEKNSNIINSGRVGLSSRKANNNKAFVSTFINPVQNRYSIRDSLDESTIKQQLQEPKEYAEPQEITPSMHEHTRCRSVNQSKQESIAGKLPFLRSSLQNYEEPQHQTFYSSYQNPNQKQASSRERLAELESKIEILLEQKLRIISSTDAFASKDLQNRTAFKLLEKQMDRILFQIRRIKENESSLNRSTIEHDLIEKDTEINRNIEVLEKKVKILERLIAQKLFESDNLKNQFLMKMKKHKRNNSEKPHHRNSKSSTFYREMNLQPSNFKPNKYEKGAICAEDPTTNKADFKKPMKSYYVSQNKDNSYNSNTLTQPLPRSTYNCQYLMYGALPNELIRVKSTQKDHKIFNDGSHMIDGSTYKEDFITLKDNDRVNFKDLDAYKDKFRNIQVNYGKERNIEKINNSNSAMNYYDEAYNSRKERKQQSRIQTENPQAGGLPLLKGSSSKKLNLRVKLQKMGRPMYETLNQTEKRMSMIEQEALQKNQLFNQRIKSQIKHKNVYDQKYKFKSDLIKQKIRKYADGNNLNEKIRAHQTLAY